MGRFRKPSAEFIGAAARAALRDRRLGEIDAALGDLEALRAELTETIDAANARQRRLDEELDGVPSTHPLRAARRAVGDLTRAVTDAQRRAAALHARAEQARVAEPEAARR